MTEFMSKCYFWYPRRCKSSVKLHCHNPGVIASYLSIIIIIIFIANSSSRVALTITYPRKTQNATLKITIGEQKRFANRFVIHGREIVQQSVYSHVLVLNLGWKFIGKCITFIGKPFIECNNGFHAERYSVWTVIIGGVKLAHVDDLGRLHLLHKLKDGFCFPTEQFSEKIIGVKSKCANVFPVIFSLPANAIFALSGKWATSSFCWHLNRGNFFLDVRKVMVIFQISVLVDHWWKILLLIKVPRRWINVITLRSTQYFPVESILFVNNTVNIRAWNSLNMSPHDSIAIERNRFAISGKEFGIACEDVSVWS